MDYSTDYVNQNKMIINQTCNANDYQRCLVSMTTKKIKNNGGRLIKGRTHDQVFLDKFLGSFTCSCVQWTSFSPQLFLDKFCLLVENLSKETWSCVRGLNPVFYSTFTFRFSLSETGLSK